LVDILEFPIFISEILESPILLELEFISVALATPIVRNIINIPKINVTFVTFIIFHHFFYFYMKKEAKKLLIFQIFKYFKERPQIS
jgi:hypothetical protein